MFLKNKVTLALVLTLNCQFFIPLIYSSNDQDIYPFSNDPNMSWREFENDFREKYQSLQIPPIHVIHDTVATTLDFGPAMYAHENDEDWKTLSSQHAINAQLPVIVVAKKEITSSHLMGYTLLHEIGHHYYDSKLRKQKQDKAAILQVITALTLLAGNGRCLYHNYHAIVNKAFTPKKGIAQLFLGSLLLFKNETFGQLINNFMIKRSEEYFADNFANQHATIDMMKAAQHDFSVQGLIEQFMSKETSKKGWSAMSPEQQEQTKHLAESVHSFFYSLFDKVDITPHPSEKKRQALIEKALKERFEIGK